MKRKLKATRSGFTIVELLIVIVVIAILATISVVAYRGVQDRANESAIKSDLNNFRKKLEILKIDSSTGAYPVFLNSQSGFKLTRIAYKTGTSWNVHYCPSLDRLDYAFGVFAKNGTWYILRSSGDITTGVSGINSTYICNQVGNTAAEVTNGYSGASQTWFSWTD